MDRTVLLNQIDFVQARIEEMDKLVINGNPAEKGFKEIMDNYNKWTDRYNELMVQLEKLDKEDLEKERLNLERDKFEFQKASEVDKNEIEKLKVSIQEELEQDKLNLERDRFAYEVKKSRLDKALDVGLKVGELGVRVAVPIIGVCGTIAVAKLSYINDAELKLCNGRIFAGAKEIIKLTQKV